MLSDDCPQKVSVRELMDEGYIQEMNRVFLHPLGLSMGISSDESGEPVIEGIFDYRGQEKPVAFHKSVVNSDGFIAKKNKIAWRMDMSLMKREECLGFGIQGEE